MHERTRQRWAMVARLTFLSAVLGAVYGYARSGPFGFVEGAVNGLLIGSVLTTCETFFMDAPAGAQIRRLPVGVAFALKIALYTAVILPGLYAGTEIGAWLSGDPRADIALATSMLFSFAAAAIVNTVLIIRRLIGPTLTALLVGRYRHAREEERAVLFLDLRGSTSLAERLGNARFVEFLDRVIFAATEPIAAAGGTIYRYVGDEIIVTWPLARGRVDPRCLACPFAIDEAIARDRMAWEREYGAVPSFRAGLHAGPVVVSELGDIKREIVLLGDTMNTTARITDLCRDAGRPYLASAAALAAGELPPGLAAESLGHVALRGKVAGLELFALTRAAVSPVTDSMPAFG
jgi:adenylate cyclase